jgi:ribosomal protein S18 acetylase RimI-like enzyme
VTTSSQSSAAVITIRQALPSEYPAVGELTYQAYAVDGLLDADPEYATQLRDARDRASSCELLVAIDDTGAVIGTVTFCLPGSPYAELSHGAQGELRMLAVAEAARHRGVGTRLVREGTDVAQRHGCRSVVITTRPQMEAARRVYTRFGFARAAELDWTPVPDVELLAYTKVL